MPMRKRDAAITFGRNEAMLTRARSRAKACTHYEKLGKPLKGLP